MVYEIVEEKVAGKKMIRTYRNQQGSESQTQMIYKDLDGRRWWGFIDLYKIPVIRKSMASYITNLYNVGLSVKDILKWCADEKALVKGNDPEKYEKLYALILEKEKIATFTADPIKQGLALATVYILSDEERIDYFTPEESESKMRLWAGMPEAVGFFLKFQNDHIERYMKLLGKASPTVLNQEKLRGQSL